MRFFDTHAHLSDDAFDSDRHVLIPSLIERGVEKVIDVGCDIRTADKTINLLDKYPFIYGAVGMHPHDVKYMDNALMDKLAEYMHHEKVQALGEIGLDYHYDNSPRDIQRAWFVEQLELAKQLGYPVVLHIREAFGDCMEILKAHKDGLHGVMHCYSGSVETAYECLDLGLSFSFGGAITFKNARKVLDVITALPIENILLETDCPYMTPEPHRGKRNDPGYLNYICEKLAEQRKMDKEEVAELTYQNAMELFKINE